MHIFIISVNYKISSINVFYNHLSLMCKIFTLFLVAVYTNILIFDSDDKINLSTKPDEVGKNCDTQG